MSGRNKAPAIGSAPWILDERHQANDLVAQELEDFGFSVRNELEWLNEHMMDIFANNGQNNLDVFKTPGKLRAKTPRTARKKIAAEPRQPLANILDANAQRRPSAAEESLIGNLQKIPPTTHFHIAEDAVNAAPVPSPVAKTPIVRQLFSKPSAKGKENADASCHDGVVDERPTENTGALWSPVQLTQDTAMSSEPDDVFSPPATQSTQPTHAAQSFRHSIHDEHDDNERHDTRDSFVSANEAFAKKQEHNAMDNDDDDDGNVDSDAEGTVVHHELSSTDEDTDDGEEIQDVPEYPPPTRVVSEQYSISAETHEALHIASQRAHAPESERLFSPDHSTTPAGLPPASPHAIEHDNTVVHHNIDGQMDNDDDMRSPSDDSSSSPVKPLVRKSSLTFASLPAREPIIAKKSMGNRVSRTSHVDQNKARSSQLGRFTGGKSLGASQLVQPADAYHDELADVEEQHPELQREESETAKIHSQTSTQRLFDRINMLKQQNKAPKPVSQPVLSSQSSQPQSTSAQTLENAASTQASQPSYPHLPETEAEDADNDDDNNDDDDEDDWISAPAPSLARPLFNKSYSANPHPLIAETIAKLTSASDPDLSPVAESTTPMGSPTGKKYMDGHLSASKAKFYSALRAAKEKIIGSSATSAQVKLDTLTQSPMRPKSQAQRSSDEISSSPMRNDKTGSIFSHMRTSSKDSLKSNKMISSPLKEDNRRTRSSTEREKRKEKETREKEIKEAKQKRSEEKLKEMREKEQSKAAAHHQKSKMATSKLQSAMVSQSSLRQGAATPVSRPPVAAALQEQPISRSGPTRADTVSPSEDIESADEMPPPPPKSLLPTTKPIKASLREPRKLVKPTSKDALPKTKAPQKIMVNLNSSRYGQAPPPAPRPASAAANKILPIVPQPISKPTAPAPKSAPSRPGSALSKSTGTGSRNGQPASKPAAPRVTRPQPQAMEKPRVPAPPRADLGTARPVSRLQTVQDANRIVVPPINPAKPAKRPFHVESDESLHRPAKRPSQQAKMNPITPAHAQFAKGKIPFAEPAYPPQSQPSQQPAIQYSNGDDIKLPEIMTDSEDEDSDNEFEQPSWVDTPILSQMLSTQQLMDPEAIFGPIAPLNMEQVFPNKERHKRFRERTSSAFWANDELTTEEKRKEREARERLVREGAWTYNPSPRPTPRPGPSH